ncbi:MAG: flavin reductase family protein [Thermodesulfobacteriota bacterium]|nr:MAG: flavin reductase family protein [Thermodesulfobacteriota bacterium]
MSSVKEEISKAQGLISHGVYVISTVHEGRANALTAAWVARASFVPPLVTVSVGKARFSHDLIRDAGIFAVNILGPEDVSIGKHFGLKTGRKTDKFAGIEYEIKATGAPVLVECAAWLDCRVASSHDAGDHTLFIGEVLEAGVRRQGAKPLIYERENFFK